MICLRLSDVKALRTPASVALGNFDGVHRGHTALLSAAVRYAHENGLLCRVYTFFTHPENYKSDHKALLTLNGEKEALFSSLGIDELVYDDFDRVKALPCADFCDEVLCGALSAAAVFCGENYAFGKNRSGNADTLRELLADRGIPLLIEPSVTDEVTGEVISSTAIRRYIAEGNAEDAARLLGRPYSLTGEVIHGKRLGTTIGTPTINQKLPECKMHLPYGVYAALCTIDGKTYRGVADIGVKPTVNENDGGELCETHLLGCSGDLYGMTLTVRFHHRLREEKKFSSLDELTRAIRRDIEDTNRFFDGKGNKDL